MAAQTYASRNIFSLEVGTADVGKTKSGDPHTRTPYLRLARGAVYALLRVKAAQRRAAAAAAPTTTQRRSKSNNNWRTNEQRTSTTV